MVGQRLEQRDKGPERPSRGTNGLLMGRNIGALRHSTIHWSLGNTVQFICAALKRKTLNLQGWWTTGTSMCRVFIHRINVDFCRTIITRYKHAWRSLLMSLWDVLISEFKSTWELELHSKTLGTWMLRHLVLELHSQQVCPILLQYALHIDTNYLMKMVVCMSPKTTLSVHEITVVTFSLIVTYLSFAEGKYFLHQFHTLRDVFLAKLLSKDPFLVETIKLWFHK